MFAVPQTALMVNHLGQGHTAAPSPRIWRHLHSPTSPDATAPWYGFFDNFVGYTYLASSGVCPERYYGFIENSGTITSLASDIGGVVRLATGTTADNDCSMGTGGGTGGGAAFKVGVGTPGAVTANGSKLLFEARVRTPQALTVDQSIFVGLAEQARILDNGFITDAHAVASIDYLGFYILDSDTAQLSAGYGVNGTGSVEAIATAGTVVTNTWIKCGFVYDPTADTTERIKYFVNGAELSTYVTGTTVSAATFPGGEEMGPAIDVKTDASAAGQVDIDWWAVAQQVI